MRRTQQYSHGTSGRTSHSPAKSVRHCGCDGSAFQHGFGPSEKCVQLKGCGAIALCAERAPSRPPEIPLFHPPAPAARILVACSRAGISISISSCPAASLQSIAHAHHTYGACAHVRCAVLHSCAGCLSHFIPPPRKRSRSISGSFRDRSVEGSCPLWGPHRLAGNVPRWVRLPSLRTACAVCRRPITCVARAVPRVDRLACGDQTVPGCTRRSRRIACRPRQALLCTH